MTSGTASGHGRDRVTFDLYPDLHGPVESAIKAERGNARAFYNNAIRQYLWPVFRFFRPTPKKHVSLQEFLKDSQEVIMVGMTLSSLQEQGDGSLAAFLRDKIRRDQCAMTFMTLDPEIPDDDPVYQVLSRRYVDMHPDGLRVELEKTHKVLAELRQVGSDAKIPVHVVKYKELPTCGMTFSDPYAPECKVRVALYLTIYDNELHPLLDVNSMSEEGQVACNAFRRYYERLGQNREIEHRSFS